MSEIEFKFAKVEGLSRGSKLGRLLNNPVNYLLAIGIRKFIYPFTRKGILRKSKLFFGKEISILLPAGSDIYITGGKTHDSEIRLTKFILKYLSIGDSFIDVGAHFGYFTLLASELVGQEGKVFSIEPAVSSYKILLQNTKNHNNIATFNLAASDSNGSLNFYEFPNKYSEYNSFDITQFNKEDWFESNKPTSHIVNCITLDEIVEDNKITPKMIKVDVEGAEFKVFTGLSNFLESNNSFLIMEYLASNRSNSEHIKAKTLLESKGFTCYTINSNGDLTKNENIEEFLTLHNIDSDNLVFTK